VGDGRRATGAEAPFAQNAHAGSVRSCLPGTYPRR
jgi:hypothetical protein